VGISSAATKELLIVVRIVSQQVPRSYITLAEELPSSSQAAPPPHLSNSSLVIYVDENLRSPLQLSSSTSEVTLEV